MSLWSGWKKNVDAAACKDKNLGTSEDPQPPSPGNTLASHRTEDPVDCHASYAFEKKSCQFLKEYSLNKN